MANNETLIPIPGRLHSVATEGHVAGADEIYDDTLQKDQATINSELIEAVGTGGSVDTRITNAVNVEKTRAEGAESTLDSKITAEQTRATSTENALDNRVDTLEEAVGTGGSVDSRITSAVATETSRAQGVESTLQTNIDAEALRAQAAEADRYTKEETYNKTELNNLITTPNQEYVSVTATDQTTSVTDVLPATGATNTIYRVGNWDGTQHNDSVFSEYAWDGNAYIKLSTKSQIGEVYDISANHADTKYADLAAALGTDGANIPQSLRKGGMSVKYVQSSGNNYIRYNLIANEFTTDVTKWAICDDDMYIDNSEFINVKTDKEGKVLEAIRTNGTKVVFSDLEVRGMINGMDLASKIDKEDGKGLIDNEVANNIFYIESNEWLYLMLDNEEHILYGKKIDGSFYEAKVNQTEIKESYIIDPDIKKTELLGREKMKNHIGVNVHVNYSEETAIFDNLLNTAKECGASMFRSMGENADAAFVCKQNNVPVWISKMAAPATVLEKDERGNYVLIDGKYVETADFIDYINDVTRIVTKFNGATDITLSSGNTEKILADFFECCNEWYFDSSITTLEVFYTYKKIYSIIKSISPKTKFVVGSQIASEYTTALFDFVDEEGTRFTDIFDVYNYHYYSNSIVDSIGNGNYINSKVNINYDVFKENLADKDIWVTETGDNIRAVSLNNQARNLLHRMLISFSYGVALVTYYAYMAYEDMYNTFEVGENYYGIIHRAIHNSYATIHDGVIQGKGLYGPDPVREYLVSAQWLGTQAVKPENLIIIDISNNSALNNIISNGVQISGNGFVVDKACVVNPVNGTIYDYFLYRENKYHDEDIFKVLDISNTNNWSGTKNITTENVDFFKLNPNLFVDLEDFVREGTQVSDRRNHIFILIYVTNISDTTFKYENQSTWDDWKFEPLPAYKSLKLLSQLLDEGSTRPIRNYYLGVNIFNWKNSKGNNVWCMFTDGNSKTIKLEFENQDNGMMIDYQGNIISGITSSIEVTSYPVFFVNTSGKLEISNI